MTAIASIVIFLAAALVAWEKFVAYQKDRLYERRLDDLDKRWHERFDDIINRKLAKHFSEYEYVTRLKGNIKNNKLQMTLDEVLQEMTDEKSQPQVPPFISQKGQHKVATPKVG